MKVPRIHALEKRVGDERYKRGFEMLRRRRLQEMMDSFWRNVALQAKWDGKDGARLADYVACRPLSRLADALEQAGNLPRFKTDAAWRNPIAGA